MNKNYPLVDRPKIENPELNERLNGAFDSLDAYKNNITPFLYTDIKIDYKEDDERFILSRFQHVLSSSLFRSLYVRNAVVESINSRNIVGVFTSLKSFIEIPALLAYIYSVLERDIPQQELMEVLSCLVFGNRGDGELRVGTRKAVNVMTMFEKLECFMKKIQKGSSSTTPDISKVMSEFYDLVCNVAHPNYDAHDITGTFEIEKGEWRCFTPEEMEENIFTESGGYLPPLILTLTMIETLSNVIYKHKKIQGFQKLNSRKYFQ